MESLLHALSEHSRRTSSQFCLTLVDSQGRATIHYSGLEELASEASSRFSTALLCPVVQPAWLPGAPPSPISPVVPRKRAIDEPTPRSDARLRPAAQIEDASRPQQSEVARTSRPCSESLSEPNFVPSRESTPLEYQLHLLDPSSRHFDSHTAQESGSHPRRQQLAPSETVEYDISRIFLACNQLLTRKLCHRLIYEVEPNKRKAHPYQKGDAAKSIWWPSHVQHISPHHLRRRDRCDLLAKLVVFNWKMRDNLKRAAMQFTIDDAQQTSLVYSAFEVLEKAVHSHKLPLDIDPRLLGEFVTAEV